MNKTQNILDIDTQEIKKLSFEKKGYFLHRIFYFFVRLVVILFPKFLISFIFIKPNHETRMARKHKGKAPIMEFIYTYKRKDLFTKNFFKNALYNIMLNVYNAKAVRNRAKIEVYLLRHFLQKIKKNKLNVLSIASGSGRSIFKALYNKNYNKKINIILVDKDEKALLYSKELLKKFNLHLNKDYSFNFINETISNIGSKLKNKQDIVEVFGLLDYYDYNKSIDILKNAFGILNKRGVLIICNVIENKEQIILDKVFQWKLFYKSKEELRSIVYAAGFNKDKTILIKEQLGIYNIIVSQK